MIQVHVNRDRCQHYGQCVLEAPELFQINTEDHLEHQATVDSSRLVESEAAADICPMQAITLTRLEQSAQ